MVQPINLKENISALIEMFRFAFAEFQHLINIDVQLLGIMEQSPTKGYHMHLLIYTPLLFH